MLKAKIKPLMLGGL